MNRFIKFLFKAMLHAGKAFIFVSLLVMSFYVVQGVIEDNQANEAWVEYQDIRLDEIEGAQSNNQVVLDVRAIRMVSTSKYPNGAPLVEWNDIMRCDTDGDGIFEFFSQMNSQQLNMEPRPDFREREWRFSGDLPKVPAVCYIKSNIRLTTPRGTEKFESQQTEPPFFFVQELGQQVIQNQ